MPLAAEPTPVGRERTALAAGWLPSHVDTLLDAGCAEGETTAFFSQRATNTYGIDFNADAVHRASERFPSISFTSGSLEALPYESSFFDAVVCCDVLEHVRDERASLDELDRVLRPGGTLILTVPHRGLFAGLDPVNLPKRVAPHVRTRLPGLYRRLAGGAAAPWWEQEAWHRHYGLDELVALLDASSWNGRYEVQATNRGGLLVYPLALWAPGVSAKLLGARAGRIVGRASVRLAALDFRLPAGGLSYNLGLKIRKAG